MRPNISDLLEGINKTVMSVSIPIVQRSGDMQALWEMASSTRIMAYVQKRWKNEFGRLAGDNTHMADLLKDCAAALREAGSDKAEELERIAADCHCDIQALPSIDELEEMNRKLMSGLEIFIVAHSEMGAADTPGLQAARGRVREFLKEVTLRDFEAAQEVIFF